MDEEGKKKINFKKILFYSMVKCDSYRGRGMPRMGPMGNPPRGFNGPMNMRGRGMNRGMPPRMMGFRYD